MPKRGTLPNKPLQLTGPAPALVIRGFGRAGPAAERHGRWADKCSTQIFID